MPIRHIVFCKFRSDVPLSAQNDLIAEIGALDQHDGIRFANFQSGPNVSQENLSHGLTLGFSMDFDSAAERDAYLVHPEHQKLGAALVALLESGTDSLSVFDMPVNP